MPASSLTEKKCTGMRESVTGTVPGRPDWNEQEKEKDSFPLYPTSAWTTAA